MKAQPSPAPPQPVETPATPFETIYRDEWKEIQERRRQQLYVRPNRAVGREGAPPPNLVGLALSGGGIRSATFCLGLLQGLHKLKLLRIFDYLSTVSGGGYVGGWWSAWLSRDQINSRFYQTSQDEADVELRSEDIKNPVSLLIKLRGSGDEVSIPLREQHFSPEILRLLATFKENDSSREELANAREAIAGELNRAIRDKFFSRLKYGEPPPPEAEGGRADGGDGGATAGRHSAWVNRLILEDAYPCEFKDIFPPREQIETERFPNDAGDEPEALPASTSEGTAAAAAAAQVPKRGGESSMNAWLDPIHHLRLYANYLTPRRGLLSYDTWRAVSVITRNLTLTWLVLLPVLTAVMLVGQLYFIVFLDSAMSQKFVGHAALSAAEFGARLGLIAQPVLAIAGLIGVLWVAWLFCLNDRSSFSDLALQVVCLLAVLLIAGVVVHDYAGSVALADFFRLEPKNWRILSWLAVAGSLFTYAMFWPVKVGEVPGGDAYVKRQWARELRRHKISRIHTKLMIWMGVVAAVLLLAGFGHELLDRLFTDNQGTEVGTPSGLKLGGLIPLLGAIGGSIFTALKAAPSADEKGQRREPSFIARLIFAVTPSLVIVVLAITVSWAAHEILGRILPLENGAMRYENIPKFCTVAGILLCFALAIYEMRWHERIRPSWALLFFAGLLAISLLWFGNDIVPYLLVRQPWVLVIGAVFGIVSVLIVLQRLNVWEVKRRIAEGRWAQREAIYRNIHSIVASLLLAGLVATLVFDWGFFASLKGAERVDYKKWSSVLPAALTALAGSIILFRLLVVRRENGHSAFELKAFRDTALGRRPEALLMVGLISLLLPVAAGCWFRAVMLSAAPSGQPGALLKLAVLPLLLAALAGGVILFRVIALKDKARQPGRYVALPKVIQGFFHNHLSKFNLSAKLVGLAEEHRGKVLFFTTVGSILLAARAGLALRGDDDAPQSMASGLVMTSNPLSIVVLLCLSLVLLRMSVVTPARAAKVAVLQPVWQRRIQDHSRGLAWLLAAACIGAALLIGYMTDERLTALLQELGNPSGTALGRGVIAGMVACFILAVFEMKWGKGDNRRSLWLLACTYATLTTLFLVNSVDQNNQTLNILRSVFGLIVAVLVWVVALGWMVDPNGVSMHHFYKGRLVRAYLGASNLRRREQHKEIAELAADDDPYLGDLKNCQRGAPYHVVNTTLNLVAGRDLATAQRSASHFMLSKNYCGSLRTKYRPTPAYMRGQLTLGTAIAASGAAVSPNMGSKKPTAALAMLLTLLNVRLGFWAPTPNMENWRMSQPRLWPFYLLREFLSQTNDLSSYCYLTDGGHFDNTGLYALVERGCRHIVLVDCGADPQPSCFQDLGDAIRRCRIDFGTEVKIDLAPFIARNGDHSQQSFAVGGIRYSRKHAKALGWDLLPEEDSKEDKDSRTGFIVYFKPAIVGCETADVRQYAIENKHFPQQTTANQWFDEAQFESYRRLGQLCAKKAFGKLKAVERLRRSARLSPALIEELFAEANQKFNANAAP